MRQEKKKEKNLAIARRKTGEIEEPLAKADCFVLFYIINNSF